ncbi:DUF4817 domain-containing protein [Trichonephila clavipes]|nr:DUF4817 domain-containing protein [Trichonephila clavipes]
MFSQDQRIAIVEFYFEIKPHCRVINAFQQKYPGETAPNASSITLLVQLFHDTGSVADRKRSYRASTVKTKVVSVETLLQIIPLKRPPICIDIITEVISLLKLMKGTLGCSKTIQRESMEVLTEFFDDRSFPKDFGQIVYRTYEFSTFLFADI